MVRRTMKLGKTSLERRDIEATYPIEDDFKSIRIHIDTTYIDDNTLLTTEKKTFLKDTIFPQAKELLEKTLNVRRVIGNFEVERNCEETWGNGNCRVAETVQCGPSDGLIDIPTDHYQSMDIYPTSSTEGATEGGGIADTDFVIYMMAKNIDTERCKPDENGDTSGVMAYAGYCFRDDVTNRPVIGYSNVCESYVDPTMTEYQQTKYVKVIVHEIFHAMGFSPAVFDLFSYPNGTSYPNGIYQDFNERGHTVRKFVTPKAIEVAKEHFGCEDINGIEIEDGGGSGSSGSHTEGRIYHGDLMNAVVDAHPTISPICVAIMEDSGWYTGNYENLETLYYGKDQGCDFAYKKKCIENGVVTGPDNGHFCTEDGAQRCTANRKGIGYCSLKSYSDELPDQFQYFSSDPTKGSYLETDDYCPIYQVINTMTTLGEITSTDCLDSTNNPVFYESYFGEEYGLESACFLGNMYNFYIFGYDHLATRGRCYRYKCENYDDGSLKGLTIYIDGGLLTSLNDNKISCYIGDQGQKKAVIGAWLGAIQCPDDYSIYCGSNVTLGPVYVEPGWIEQLTVWSYDNYLLLIIAGALFCVTLFFIFCIPCSVYCYVRLSRGRAKIIPVPRHVTPSTVEKARNFKTSKKRKGRNNNNIRNSRNMNNKRRSRR